MRGKFAEWLLRLRVLVLDHEHAHDPFSPEYLYLLQQRKRLDLSKTLGRLRPGNILIFPAILLIAWVRCIDLRVTNVIVQSMINERILLRHIAGPRQERPE
ncbi:MAG: hypothetical protein J0I21_05160 [Alphaproteobacteria bacterium]|nr:hypothetical protein [Alphaproteobacteria bacterium]